LTAAAPGPHDAAARRPLPAAPKEGSVRDITDRALDTARVRGASYADVRVNAERMQYVEVKNGRVTSLADTQSSGLGVRVMVDGAWGFCAGAEVSAAEADRCAALAVAIARASARVRRTPIGLSPVAPVQADWETPHRLDPFRVPLSQKVDLLLAADRALAGVRGLKLATSSLQFWEDRKVFASSEGSYITQRILHSGGGLVGTAASDDDIQVRSYPASFGGQFESGGFEVVERLDLPGHAEQAGEEAVALLTAKPCPAGRATVILDGSQTSLQIHESCGHPSELDRVLGWEANYAGTSFLTPEKRGTLRYGSDHVTLVADATAPRGMGTFGYDDEGVPAQCADLVRDGLFVGYLTSRETAPQLGQASNGTMRAESWAHIPIIRMTNINLLPGRWKLADLIADTRDGIYMLTNRSWSIDDKRYNFQFGTELGYEIKNGKLGAMLKNCTYTGITPRFWNSCDAVCDASDWEIWGTPNCGKAQPSQTMRTAQAAASARFRDVQVGVGFKQ
jgi:TldD protein